MKIIKDLERKETEYMRLKRHKICVDDFDLLTIIGRGAFGEVWNYVFTCLVCNFVPCSTDLIACLSYNIQNTLCSPKFNVVIVISISFVSISSISWYKNQVLQL